MKKDVKKSSYYVWFLGAHECKNVRDVDSVLPAISALADREKKVTPHKFTLQVSHRGLKIVHNVSAALSGPAPAGGCKGSKGDQLVKHLIPDHAVTCVHRDEDLVAVILLLYNPVTRWPVHVHVYRCDSVETAALLSGQLRTLVDRPENRKKLDEIELRLEQACVAAETATPVAAGSRPGKLTGGRNPREPSRKTDTPPPTVDCRLPLFPPALPPPPPPAEAAPGDPRMTALYDSLAAELKKKLGTGGCKSGAPILLPPRDYDTVHRHRGNLNGIDFRRCMSANIVGVNGGAKQQQQQQQQEIRRSGTKMQQGSSGGSSGIGSDHAPSPEQYEPDNAYADCNNSSSDEDWNASPLEEPVFAKPSVNDHPLPRVRRQDSGVDSSSSPVQTSPEKDFYYGRQQEQHVVGPTHVAGKRQNHNAVAQNLREKYSDRNVALVQPRPRRCENGVQAVTATAVPEYRRKPAAVDVRQRTPSPSRSPVKETPRERFKDAKEKFLMLEKERIDEQRSALRKCMELRQRRDNGAVQQSQVIRAAVRGDLRGDRSKGRYDSDDESDRRYYGRYDDGDVDEDDDRGDEDYDDRRGAAVLHRDDKSYDGSRPRYVVRGNDRSMDSVQQQDDRDYRHGDYPKPRRSRNAQQDEPRPAPRSYSADEYADHGYRPSPPADRYCKSPQRRTVADAPRAAPRRARNSYDDAPPPPAPASSMHPSRASDYKRRSAAYAYDGGGGRGSPGYGRHQLQELQTPTDGRSSAADDDGRLPVQPPVMAGRDYKRRSAAYAYDDQYDYNQQHRPQHVHHQDVGGGGGSGYPPAAPVSPRYRHSYAEAYHAGHRRHHQQRPPSPQDPVHRHGGSSLQPSGRIGIAAIHPY